VILLYHLIFPDDTPAGSWNAGNIIRVSAFRRQLRWLRRHFSFVSLEEYVALLQTDPKLTRANLALTFDDGYARTYALAAPVLREEGIPTTFFANTVNRDKGLLWFVYFNALCSEKAYPAVEINGVSHPLDTKRNSLRAWKALIQLARSSPDARAFADEFASKYPLPAQIQDNYAGLRSEQLAEIGASTIFSLGGHTHSHPYLDQLGQTEQRDEMLLNRQILEQISGKPVSFFAYPGGVYNQSSITAAQQAGFRAAFAVTPARISADPMFEIPRSGVFSPALWKLQVKVLGLVDFLRAGRSA
jgi:peptidoglycan/xylan/chitin deacetylase (PgdA/CDA1 family)